MKPHRAPLPQTKFFPPAALVLHAPLTAALHNVHHVQGTAQHLQHRAAHLGLDGEGSVRPCSPRPLAQVVSLRQNVHAASLLYDFLLPVASPQSNLAKHTTITLQDLCLQYEKRVMMKCKGRASKPAQVNSYSLTV
jgi:hypothetical protein